MSTTVQLISKNPIADDRYVADRGWEDAFLEYCPFHPEGGCGVVRHGSYPRVEPTGVRVARFRCRVAGQTISLLPAFLSARLRGTLDGLEAVVATAEESSSMAAAAEVLRPAEEAEAVTSTSALRWVRRRVQAVRRILKALVTLLPETLGCTPSVTALRVHLGTERVLVTLRSIAAAHLAALPPPLGLLPRGRR